MGVVAQVVGLRPLPLDAVKGLDTSFKIQFSANNFYLLIFY